MTRILTVGMVMALMGMLATAVRAEDGAAVFKQNCAKCHGETGQSDTAAGKALKVPHLAGDAKVAAMSSDDLVANIKANEKHKAFIGKLSAADVAAAAAHAKGLAEAK